MVNNQYPATNLEAFMKIAANWQNGSQNLLEAVDLKGDMQQYLNNTSMNMYKKRERTQNWNHQEKKFLLDLCRKDMRIIENKRLDAGLTAVKNKAWKIIHQKFSRQFGTDRTCNRLKEQWRRMKACTRNEILDYNNRLTKLGSEVADRKRPSPFTFEVWEFMQEAKKACKSEALDGIDYSKMPLALEEDFEYREDEQNVNDDQYMDDSRTPPQELCDVDIKEENVDISLKDNFNGSYNQESFGELSSNKKDFNSYHHTRDHLSAFSQSPSSSSQRQCRSADDLKRVNIQSPVQNFADIQLDPAAFLAAEGNCDLGAFQSTFNMSNISATLEALNALRNGQFQNAAAAAAAAVAVQNKIAHQQLQEELSSPPNKRQRTSSISTHSEPNETDGRAVSAVSTTPVEDTETAKEPIDNTELDNKSNSNNINNNHDVITKNRNKNDENCNSEMEVAIKVGSGKLGAESNDEIRALMEMQNKEHLMRMKILEVQLQAAKHNRDLIEINKTFAMQRLQEYASKRLAH